MRKSMLLICFLLSVFTAKAGRIITDSISSQTLNATVKFNVYVPGRFENTNDHYPVVYLLHGLTDTFRAWEQKGGMREITDDIIDSGEAVPMVIVMPNAGGRDVRNIWNGYFNMPGWSYEDFFFNELVPFVESKYRCGGSKQQRAVMGLSMGGGGSTVYAQRHPDLFAACYAMSPWLNSEGGRAGQNGEKDKMYYTSEAVKEFSALAFMNNADDATREALRTVKWFFDCGDDDGLLNDTFELYKKMRMARIHAEFRVRDGKHNWEYWRAALRIALPFASRNFK